MTVDAPAVAIFEAVKQRLHVSFEEMAGRSRVQSITHARYLTMFLLRQEGWSFPRISKLLNRHHTIAMWACKRVLIEPAYADDLPVLREMLASEPPPREAAP